RAPPCTGDRRGSRAARARDSWMLLQRSRKAKPLKRTGPGTPVRHHLDPQVQIDPLSEQLFDAVASIRADGAQGCAACPDHNGTLTRSFDIDGHPNIYRLG